LSVPTADDGWLAGKSECSKCGSGTGRFCRACLAVRYGQDLADVRAAMAAGAWLCPHCYEAEHPDEVRMTVYLFPYSHVVTEVIATVDRAEYCAQQVASRPELACHCLLAVRFGSNPTGSRT